MSFIGSYKTALREEINTLLNKTVYTIRENPLEEIKLCGANYSNQRSLSGLIFSTSDGLKIEVNLMMQNIQAVDGDVGVRFALPLRNGGTGLASAVTFLKWSEDASKVRWKEGNSICAWSTRQNILKIQDHRAFWYGDQGKLSLSDDYKNFSIENFEGGLSVSLNNLGGSGDDDFYQLTFEAVVEGAEPEALQPIVEEPVAAYAAEENVRAVEIAEIAKIHAHAIVLKAFDLALYQFRTVKNEFAVTLNDKRQYSNAVGHFPFAEIVVATDANNQVPFLLPSELKERCKSKNLYFSDELYQAVSVSINSGRHIIFTGPPGCGKSQLAEQVGTLVAEIFNAKKGVEAIPKFVTASPSWTSGEVIGRYFPGRDKDSLLEFHPGVFLEAVKNKRCLVIDEINRANMDECFGELFTVLAGQACDLLYQDAIEGSANEDGKIKYGPIKIVPYQQEDLSELPGYCIYSMGEGFRLIGTMNTFDRSALHQMSFALMRRFDVISVSAPSVGDIEEIVKGRLEILLGENQVRLPTWGGPANRGYLKDWIGQLVVDLFAGQDGLVAKRIVGASMVVDFLDFIACTLNPASNEEVSITNIGAAGIGHGENAAKAIVKSAMALALVVKLIPQLESSDGKLGDVISKIRTLLGGCNRVNFSCAENGLQIELIPAATNCFAFFASELRLACQHTPLSGEIEAVLTPNAAA